MLSNKGSMAGCEAAPEEKAGKDMQVVEVFDSKMRMSNHQRASEGNKEYVSPVK